MLRMQSIAVGALTITCACVYAAAMATAASSCGSHNNPDAAFESEADDAGSEASTPKRDGSVCQPSSDEAEPQLLAQVVLDGGVPLAQVPFAVAVARCNYFSRCSPMAAYEVDECITAFSQSDTWNDVGCANPAGYDCAAGTISGTQPNPAYPNTALLQAVEAGLLEYDPNEEAACLRALQAQACHGFDLWYNIPHCTGSFFCLSDAGAAGPGSVDATVVDGGSSCADFVLSGSPLSACTTDSDCAGDAGAPSDPYCVDDYCFSRPCGELLGGPDGGCPSFVNSGQRCDSEAPTLGRSDEPTPWGAVATETCAPGLACRGLSADGGLGTCAKPEDIGGSCSENAAVSGCALGLICQCGACRMPPTRGPCASGACEVGVAFCDIESDMCLPVQPLGGDCSAGFQACAPNLNCDSTTNTCQPPTL